MAVIKVTSELGNLGFDRRWRQWAKLIRDAGDFNPNAEGGFAITGPFAKWGEAVAVEGPAFILLASETGSTKHRTYDYALICVNADGSTTVIPDSELLALAQSRTFSDAIQAKALNSPTYRAGAYAWLFFKRSEAAEAEKQCPLCGGRIRNAELICRACLDLVIRQLDSLETAEMAVHAAEYAIQRITA